MRPGNSGRVAKASFSASSVGIIDHMLVSISMHKCVSWVYLSSDFDLFYV